MKINWKKIIPHIVSIVLIFLINIIYFFPQVQGKVVSQGDIISSDQASKGIMDYIKENDRMYHWNPSQFGGMPQLTNARSNNNLIYKAYSTFISAFKEPMGMFIVGSILVYIMLLSMGLSPWLSLIFCFPAMMVTGNFILWEAGHNSKLRTLIFTPLLIAGIMAIFENKKYWLGFIFLSLGFSISFFTRHPQMTYYILLVFLIYGLILLYQTIRNKTWDHFIKGTLIVASAMLIGLATSTTKIWSLYDYSKVTMRGDAILKSSDIKDNSNSSEVDGLAWDYAMNWSNDYGDLAATFIPGFQGGGGSENVSKQSESFKRFRTDKAPLYWGSLPSTVGPLYQGASMIFLFILGLFIVKGRIKWWLGIGAVWMMILSMGSNFEIVNRIVYDVFPFYSKFRAPSSVLNIASFFVVLLAGLSLHEFLKSLKVKKISKTKAKKSAKKKVDAKKSVELKGASKFTKPLFISYAICGGIALLMALIGTSIFEFTGPADAYYQQQQGVVSTFISDRKSLFRSDSWRSFFIVSAVFGLLFAYLKNYLKKDYVIAGIGLIMLIDLSGVGFRYLGHGDYVTNKSLSERLNERQVDTQLKSLEPERHMYRIHDLTIPSFKSSAGSVEHNTIGGYSPAKMQRIDDLIERHIRRGNRPVLDMLNTKYFIMQGEGDSPQIQVNDGASGPAWFVSNVISVNSPQEEIDGLKTLDVANTAVILSSEFGSYMSNYTSARDSLASISISHYEPDVIIYQSESNKEMMAVFSEMWYGPNKGWQAYLDGKPVEHVRANYALRAMRVPEGKHEIKFEFKPKPIYLGETISLISSLILLLILCGYCYMEFFNKKSPT